MSNGLITGGLLFGPGYMIRKGFAPAPALFAAASRESSFLHTLLEWELDSGTLYFSFVGTSTPTQFYEGRVLDISEITQEIPVECGLYTIGNVQIQLDNADGYFSALKDSEAWANRTMRILMGYPNEGISAFLPAFTGIIADVSFDDSKVYISLTDDSHARLKRPITDVLQRIVPGGYPDASPDDAKPDLIPYIKGVHQKPVGSTRDVGQLPARRINGSLFQYVVGHGEIDVDEVYVYGTILQSGYANDTFTATGGEVFTRITFDTDPKDPTRSADEIEITWNGDTADAEFRPLYQLVDFLITRCGYTEDEFDDDNIAEQAAAMDARGMAGAWAVVDASLTIEDVVAEFLNSHASQMWREPDGVHRFRFLGTVGDSVADFRETHEIIAGSFRFQMNPPQNRASNLTINWDRNYSRGGFFSKQALLSSPSQLSAIRFGKGRKKELGFVRTLNGDYGAAFAVGALYFPLMYENTHFPEFDVHARFFSTVSLGSTVTVTHRKGVGASGYVQQRVIVLSKRISPSPEVARMSLMGVVSEEPDTDIAELSGTFALEGGIEVTLEETP